MSAAEVALLAFTAVNSVRVLAYVPQIAAVLRDRNGASAISYTTWGMFAVSHVSTVGYAILVVVDWRMAAIFGANTICCVAILGVTAQKRGCFRGARRLVPGLRAAKLALLVCIAVSGALAVMLRSFPPDEAGPARAEMAGSLFPADEPRAEPAALGRDAVIPSARPGFPQALGETPWTYPLPALWDAALRHLAGGGGFWNQRFLLGEDTVLREPLWLGALSLEQAQHRSGPISAPTTERSRSSNPRPTSAKAKSRAGSKAPSTKNDTRLQGRDR